MSAGAGLLLAGLTSRNAPADRATGSTPAVGAARASRITSGTTLVHADLHNHTLLSDGDGDPALAFDSMRSAGLDVAALTDHATLSDHVLGDVLADLLPPEYQQVAGLTPHGWARTREYADAANADGAFTAIRGFEWTEPLLGHVNVWFTEHYVDVLQAGVMAPLLDWLRREPGLVLDGGADGIAGFNHPGREQGRFEEFRFDPRVRDRMVSLEMFNRRDDFLFEGYADGRSSPLCACLDAGWRTGITGVTDEHGTDWGHPEGKGRTGLWVAEHTRAGVKAAMLARRFFATRTSGLRVDATASVGGRGAGPDGVGAADRRGRGDVHPRPRAGRVLGGPAAAAAGAATRWRRTGGAAGARVPGRRRRHRDRAAGPGRRRLGPAPDRRPDRAQRDPRTGRDTRGTSSGSPTRARGGWRPDRLALGRNRWMASVNSTGSTMLASTTYGLMPRRWISTRQPRSPRLADHVDRPVPGQRELVLVAALDDLENAVLDRHRRAGGPVLAAPSSPVTTASATATPRVVSEGTSQATSAGSAVQTRATTRPAVRTGRSPCAGRTGPDPGLGGSSAAIRSSAGTAFGGTAHGAVREGRGVGRHPAGEAEDRAAGLPLAARCGGRGRRERGRGVGLGGRAERVARRHEVLGERPQDQEPVVAGRGPGERRRSGDRRSRHW